jgi:predicted metalloprotease with PDZ domain
MLDSFVVDGRRYRTMVHHNGPVTPATRERFVHDVEKIVRYENSVFSPPPLEQYTFLFNIGFPGGDGMEHLYSTQIVNRNPWQDSLAVLPGISTAAHEYFHVWNVKRVRPAVLGPFDYTREQYQPSLWVAEGWTQYYGLAALGRAGIVPTDAFYATMGGLIQANLTAPGRKEVSARMASFHAPFWDGGAQPQPTNGANTFFSYYTKGAGLALYLDLWLREKTQNARALDDVFAALKRRSCSPRSSAGAGTRRMRRTICRAGDTPRPTSSTRRRRSSERTCTAGSSATSAAPTISITTRCSRAPACGWCVATAGRSRRFPTLLQRSWP